VVERDGLENRCTGNRTEGSNPSLSAKLSSILQALSGARALRLSPQSPDLFADRREAGETTLRQCQLVLIRMLNILDHICRRHGLSYWMTAGTLIGALRHEGMIPWDCDIDVGMTEEDYQAFAAVSAELPPDIFFQTSETDRAYPRDEAIAAKLRDRYSNYVEWQSRNPQAKWHNGLQLDILLYRRDELGRLVNPVRQTAYERSEIFPLTRIAFEGALLLAPHDPSAYIARRYGDFMTPPPPEQRVPHEGLADPFAPCDHRESRRYPRRAWRRWRLPQRARSLIGGGTAPDGRDR
jgi:phosphorylcholine metabolism protein LicD